MNNVIIVIPARYGSTRFPGKPLAELQGKPIIQWVYEACKKANCGEVIIATEDERITSAAASFGAKAVMTSADCQSGTDRIYQATKGLGADYVINVQGDEPFVQPETIKAVVELVKNDDKTDISTACMPVTNADIINNPNHVKAVLAKDMRALYFSRSPIPYKREKTPESEKAPYYLHCGIYGYKIKALEQFVKLPVSPLENLEKLEQLRALEAGMTIKSALINKAGPAIDTPADLERAKEFAKNL
ncbi:3-deoxy-manno-octulosonate cytidylyltransferase [Candidatus Proelusimicrobium excrementi]|uniref:3-deoxy-manno-octulosonate cytidylyltransferase n=1 Tax=Candidatus Proelusimicrobium excrementi TaxID=3416222 RepID=UPI003CB9AB13|nr:3-deoxy-manno-octulosonate cytidylyltransferase [Elusimicrobiaceae bacterium]